MSYTPRPLPQGVSRRRSGLRPWWFVAAGAAVAAALALAVSVSSAEDGERASSAIVPTGETNAMGAPVIDTPGTLSGTASAGPVRVSGAAWELGRVPLNVAVRPTWVLRNAGTDPVTVGEPHAEVRAGCCPGPFVIDDPTIAPGDEVRLSFELTMHPGMDGWHDMAVHVPLVTGAGEEILTLEVTGDFRS